MAFGSIQSERFGEAWTAVTALVDAEGTAASRHAAALCATGTPLRDQADAVHCLCLLHGRPEGVFEVAHARASNPVAAAWLADAAQGFAGERASLVRLMAAVGPLPSTPGQAESEAAIIGQRHAVDMLAGSDRPGCAVGAAIALLLDWANVRRLLETVGERTGVEIAAPALPPAGDTATAVAALAQGVAFERAMLFGAQQMLAQHAALWQLLEARSVARDHA